MSSTTTVLAAADQGHGGVPVAAVVAVTVIPLLGTLLVWLIGRRVDGRSPAIWAAGHDVGFIRSKHDRARITSMGCMVVFIALMSAGSLTTALTLSFPGPHAWLKFLPVGVVWGLIVFSLDRWIVSTIATGRLEESDREQSDGSRWSVATGLFVARLLMTLIVSTVISEPIVLALFSSEIMGTIPAIHADTIAQQTTSIRQQFAADNAAFDSTQAAKIAATLQTRNTTAATAKTATATEARLHQIYLCEFDNSGSTCASLAGQGGVITGVSGNGQQTAQAYSAWQTALTAKNSADTAAQAAQTAYTKAVAVQADHTANTAMAQSAAIATMTAQVNKDYGLLIREEALSRLMKEHASVAVTRWAVFAALCIVDLMPLLLKTLRRKSPYEVVVVADAIAGTWRAVSTKKAEADAAHEDRKHMLAVHYGAAKRERERDDVVAAEIAEIIRKQRRRDALRELGEPTDTEEVDEAPDQVDGDGWLVGGRWRLRGTLTGVSHSSVYAPFRAHDTFGQYDGDVVVKIIAEPPGQEEVARRLSTAYSEMTMPIGEIHKNLAEILDSGFDPRHGFYVVTRMYPSTLRDWLTDPDRELTLGWALDVLAQLLDGLAAAWARGYVHLDVKPANIAITEDGVVKLFDFGLLQNWQYANGGLNTTDKHARYSLFFAPPEQMARSGEWITRAADVYGAAATFYAIVSGRPPLMREAYAVGLVTAAGALVHDRDSDADMLSLFNRVAPTRLDALLPYIVPAFIGLQISRWLSQDAKGRNPGNPRQFAEQLQQLVRTMRAAVERDGIAGLVVGGAHSVDVAVPGVDLSWREELHRQRRRGDDEDGAAGAPTGGGQPPTPPWSGGGGAPPPVSAADAPTGGRQPYQTGNMDTQTEFDFDDEERS